MLAACRYSDAALSPPGSAGPLAADGTLETAAGTPDGYGLGPPFVVIQFDAAPTDPLAYEKALGEAVAVALDRRPDARFHLLAVTAGSGPHDAAAPGLDRAEAVLRSLAAMGVPPERVDLGAAVAPAATSDEVRIYLR